jgi:hypothetical protein
MGSDYVVLLGLTSIIPQTQTPVLYLPFSLISQPSTAGLEAVFLGQWGVRGCYLRFCVWLAVFWLGRVCP